MRITTEQREELEIKLIRKMRTAAKQALKGYVEEKNRDAIAISCAANGVFDGLELAELRGLM